MSRFMDWLRGDESAATARVINVAAPAPAIRPTAVRRPPRLRMFDYSRLYAEYAATAQSISLAKGMRLINVTFLADDSGSTDAAWELDNVGRCEMADVGVRMAALAVTLDDDGLMLVVPFSRDARLVTEFSPDKPLEESLSELIGSHRGGGTNFAPAIRTALDVVPDSDALQLFVLLTDGENYDEDETNEILLQHANRVFVLLVGVGKANDSMLRALAEAHDNVDVFTKEDKANGGLISMSKVAPQEMYEGLMTMKLRDWQIANSS